MICPLWRVYNKTVIVWPVRLTVRVWQDHTWDTSTAQNHPDFQLKWKHASSGLVNLSHAASTTNKKRATKNSDTNQNMSTCVPYMLHMPSVACIQQYVTCVKCQRRTPKRENENILLKSSELKKNYLVLVYPPPVSAPNKKVRCLYFCFVHPCVRTNNNVSTCVAYMPCKGGGKPRREPVHSCLRLFQGGRGPRHRKPRPSTAIRGAYHIHHASCQ